jgi:pSer/pThr/pTyr-binding forkhead associated (FHA) protein
LNIKLTVGESGVKEWTVGSQADREVQFQDSGVSALHAKIVNEGERWKVLDQMSANGTFVNGKRSNVSYLTAGDRVRFGPVECVFWTSRGAATPARRSGVGSSSGGRAESKSNTALIAGVAFAVTLVVLFLVYKFVL